MPDQNGQRVQRRLLDAGDQDLASVRPGKLLLRTLGECDLDPAHLLEVFGEQRQRFVAVLEGFGPGDWAAPTRCPGWSAHEVVRHLCDGNAIGAAAGPDDHTLALTAGFDPRTTPSGWLTASAGEPPEATLSRFVATTEELLAVLRARPGHKPIGRGGRSRPSR
jgi:uncharacterized protein (TIGR03083 family)